jgi:hypothetical protein
MLRTIAANSDPLCGRNIQYQLRLYVYRTISSYTQVSEQIEDSSSRSTR